MTTGVAIVIIVMAFNFLSDALQMAIDPRMSSKEKRLALKKGVKAHDIA
ncbi:ABC transporter permease, partial [Staphylococcus hominis]